MGRRRKRNSQRNQFEIGMDNFLQIYDFWYMRLINMAYSAITWNGINESPGVNSIEKFLIDKGKIAIFRDEILGVIALPCVGNSALNAFGYPCSYQAYGYNGYRMDGLVDGKNAVICFNNPMGFPDVQAAQIYAKRIANSIITAEINLRAQKTPIAIFTDQEQKFSVEQMYAQYDGGAPLILTKPAMREFIPEVIQTNAPYLVQNIQENTTAVWNEWLNYLGIPGSSVQKKERVLKDEVMQQMGGALASRNPRTLCRENAVKRANKMFGTEIEFYYSVDFTPPPEYIDRGDFNGEIHSDDSGFDDELSW